MSTSTSASIQPTTRHQLIQANIIRACFYCQAPGLYVEESEKFAKWGTVCMPAGSPLIGKSVGKFCPQCNFNREILQKEPTKVLLDQWTFGSNLQLWKFKLAQFLKGIVKWNS
jgi:hypothetical protein